MITSDIKNSSGKKIGITEFYEDKIIIKNNKKPELIITDPDILQISLKQEYNKSVLEKMFNDYTLPICEIASILGVYYCRANQWIKTINQTTPMKEGRRNSSYGAAFPLSRKQKIGKRNKGTHIYNNGKEEKFFRENEAIPEGYVLGRLPFSPEHRQKIREAGLSGKYCPPAVRARKGWENGKFKNVNFKRGIGGYFTSIKMKKRFFFRSLLELYYIINYLEEEENVNSYVYEPFIIHCEDKRCYTPDFLINNQQVVELKSYNFIYKQGGKIQKDFEYKRDQGVKYCQKHNLEYKVIFDEDINFKYEILLHQLQEGKYIEKYNIEFLEPERVWSRK